MFMNQYEIESAAAVEHKCPNVRKGVRLLLRLMQAVNDQSDGRHSWPAHSKSAQKLQELLSTAGNLHYGTHGTITANQLKKAIAPIRAMVTRQAKIQAKYGNTFEFDVDAALADEPSPPPVLKQFVLDEDLRKALTVVLDLARGNIIESNGNDDMADTMNEQLEACDIVEQFCK